MTSVTVHFACKSVLQLNFAASATREPTAHVNARPLIGHLRAKVRVIKTGVGMNVVRKMLIGMWCLFWAKVLGLWPKEQSLLVIASLLSLYSPILKDTQAFRI